ncbi:hypothetical protein FFLO_05182 [Filobasidium floriforme]|uniref:Phosphomevalonate kinase n=1 Tax=Filobasidium floriforme TaxID=5210 RepID=A0A8K0NLQ2_9TREE|nr:hypothetical protein FFLO_05182 [Filobasidium floriforme]
MVGSTIVSAPGKVLITGGYLVLDPAYEGTVIATSSRFFTVVTPSSSVPRDTIRVRSPQFLEAEWNYSLASGSDGLVGATPSPANKSNNKFVEIALRETLKVIQAIVSVDALNDTLKDERSERCGLKVEIVGDNDFYSQRRVLDSLSLPPNKESLDRLPRFNHLNTPIGDVHKTGLGSSAALITSLVAALLLNFSVIPASSLGGNRSHDTAANNSRQDLDFIHNTSQYIHCLAQGKVGSGFDISSAVYGSQVYKRFDESVLRSLIDDSARPVPSELLATLRPNAAWTSQTTPIVLPPRIQLLLADVDAGSDTPSLVGKVLKWRTSSPDQAREIWTRLHDDNRRVASLLGRLGDLARDDPGDYSASLEGFATAHSNTPGGAQCSQVLQDLKAAMTAVRRGMKTMGESASVPIEPDEQTELLDACCAIPGVIGGGVPGAGGYDAIYVLVVDTPDSTPTDGPCTAEQVRLLWSNWKSLSVSPLQSRAEEGGLRYYDSVAQVRGLERSL